MPRQTSAARALVGALVLGVLQVVACGTDAVGVDTCRRIELARCDAAAACGVIDDAAECRRFYHDQCLHGLPVPDPGAEASADCETTLQRAGACAVEGEELSLDECSDTVTSQPTYATTACEIVDQPQLAAECRFLSPGTEAPGEPGEPEEPAEPGAGGSAGSGGAPGEPEAGGSGGLPTE